MFTILPAAAGRAWAKAATTELVAAHRPCAAVLGHDTTTTLTMHALTVSPSDTQVRLAELTEVPSSPDCSEPVHTCTDARNLIGLSCVL